MNKYLVFALERRIEGIRQIQDGRVNDNATLIQSCFELVKEFDTVLTIEGDTPWKWAYNYSKDNKVRTVVVKGVVFGD